MNKNELTNIIESYLFEKDEAKERITDCESREAGYTAGWVDALEFCHKNEFEVDYGVGDSYVVTFTVAHNYLDENQEVSYDRERLMVERRRNFYQ